MTSTDAYSEVLFYLAQFWQAMDQYDYNRVLGMMTPDARWRRERWRTGQADILEGLQQRPANRLTRHCVTNVILEPNDDGYNCQFGLIIFGADQPQLGKGAIVTTGPRMGDWHTKIVRQDARWLTKEISASLLFERP